MKIVFLALFLSYVLSIAALPLPKLIPYRDGDKWGYCDSAGVVKIPPQWDEAEFFCGTKAVVKMNANSGFTRDDAYGLIDTSGRYIIPIAWHWNRTWRGVRLTMLNVHDSNNRYGLADTNGTLILPFAYDMPQYYRPTISSAYRLAGKDGLIGLINAAGEVMIPFSYQAMEEVTVATDSIPLFKIKVNGKFGLIDIKERTILPADYTDLLRVLDTGISYQRRSGFLLQQKVLNNRKDSTKGMRQIYGWLDYPGTTFIRPKYNWITWIAKNYFNGDERLYRIDNKPALPGSYRNIYASHDSIFATRTIKSRKDSMLTRRYVFAASDLNELYHREVWTYKSGDNRNSQSFCGTSTLLSQQAVARDAARPRISIDGKKVSRVKRNGIYWESQFWVPDHYVVLRGYREDRFHESPVFWTVADTSGRFISGELQGLGDIVGYNAPSGLIIWQNDAGYGVSNLNGEIRVPFQTKIISDAFTAKGRGQIYTVRSSPGPRRYVNSWSDPYEEPRQAVKADLHPELCKEDGLAIDALQAYDFIGCIGTDFRESKQFSDRVRVADSLGRQGFMSISGQVLLPDISFRYLNLEVLTPNLFRVELTDRRLHRLVNSRNELLLNGADIQLARFLRNRSHAYPGPLFFNNEVEQTELIYVYYSIGNQMPYQLVYMNAQGKVYAGRL